MNPINFLLTLFKIPLSPSPPHTAPEVPRLLQFLENVLEMSWDVPKHSSNLPGNFLLLGIPRDS